MPPGSWPGITYASNYTETRQYNANNQLTWQTAKRSGGSGVDLSYNFPLANNGRLQSTADNLSGEQVTYTYDQLNRLVRSASSMTGTENFTSDGFGNLTQNDATAVSV